ncbi:MAG: cadmium-translocating P-type ATPase [Elusimicrobiota bacterium]|jgi:Cd2+/Zn2+-exporting ATPase|nr:cadmium-translocating P-type ATPase [Elusimicrobiota bacterium]
MTNCVGVCCCKNSEDKKNSLQTIAGVVIFFTALIFLKVSFFQTFLFLVSYVLIGSKIIFSSFKNISKGEIFDENFLMTIATLGAIIVGAYSEAVGVMIFYQIGIFFEDRAVDKSRKSIATLMDIKPDFANLMKDGELKRVAPRDVKIGDIIEVRSGEKIPLDGIVISGSTSVDVSALTGESVLRDVYENSNVLAGSINKTGLIKIKVSKIFSQSTVAKILELVENAREKKSKAENFITKFAKVYTPLIISAAAILGFIQPVISDIELSESIYRSLVFLVVSCPCALVISVPLSFFAGIGAASKKGILIKGSAYLEGLNSAKTFVFDKTGTLTKGIFKVSKIVSKNGFSEEEVLEIAAFAESRSTHPVAKSIMRLFNKEPDGKRIVDYKEFAGYGIKANVDGKTILAGNAKFFEKENIDFEEQSEIGTIVYVSINSVFAGFICAQDALKSDAKKTIEDLKKLGVKSTMLLTGDKKENTQKISQELNIEKFFSELLPDEKINKIQEIKGDRENGKVVFIGDGINDAPALASADISFAMGAAGSDAAIESADIVLMTDELSKIITALKIAKRTKFIVWQNIIFSLVVKFSVLVLGALGIANMWSAVFADVGVTFIAILNSIRGLRSSDFND